MMPKPLNGQGLEGCLEGFFVHGRPSETREKRSARASKTSSDPNATEQRAKGAPKTYYCVRRMRPSLQVQDVGS